MSAKSAHKFIIILIKMIVYIPIIFALFVSNNGLIKMATVRLIGMQNLAYNKYHKKRILIFEEY